MDYDIAVIGGGPGGYVAAIRAAQLGAKVCLVEQGTLGGTCLNRGCIPTKALLASSNLLEQIGRAYDYGLAVQGVTAGLPQIMERKAAVVAQLVQGIEGLLVRNKVTVIRGRGRLEGARRVAVELTDGGQAELTASKIILATGSEPALIASWGYNGQEVITSNEALELTEVPESLLVIGGGVVGCELATFYAALGTRIAIVEMMSNILPTLDQEIARRQQSFLKRRGMEIYTKVKIGRVEVVGGRVQATLEDGREINAERALISVGRVFNINGLGLEEVGVTLGPRGEVEVDDYLQTSADGIYAIGDITNKMQLAHVASAQGKVAAANALGEHLAMDYSLVPSCVFTEPEIASVGLTMEEARRQGLEVKTGKFPFTASGRALAMGEKEGMVKVIAAAATGRLLGVHVHGPHASDLVGEAAVAMRAGWTAAELADTIHAHPTLAEAIMEAAEAIDGRAIHAYQS